MKREIKFRGNTREGQWVYGDLLHIAGGTLIYHGSDADYDKSKDDKIAIGLYHDEVSVVYPETVGQFTGLYDENGKEVYEGDIVVVIDLDVSEIGVVVYDNRSMAFCVKPREEIAFFAGDFNYIYKVIGNIYDNPSLLKGGKQ